MNRRIVREIRRFWRFECCFDFLRFLRFLLRIGMKLLFFRADLEVFGVPLGSFENRRIPVLSRHFAGLAV